MDNKIKQNKAQDNLDQQIPKFFAFSSRNVGKYEFLTRKYLPEKRLLEKPATIKKLKYLPVVSKFKKQTDIAQNQCEGLDKFCESDLKEDGKIINKDDKNRHHLKNKVKQM